MKSTSHSRLVHLPRAVGGVFVVHILHGDIVVDREVGGGRRAWAEDHEPGFHADRIECDVGAGDAGAGK